MSGDMLQDTTAGEGWRWVNRNAYKVSVVYGKGMDQDNASPFITLARNAEEACKITLQMHHDTEPGYDFQITYLELLDWAPIISE